MIIPVGKATTGIRVTAAKWWRHYEMVNKICRIKAYFNVISCPAKLKLERAEIDMFYIFMSVSSPDADFSF